MDKPIDLHNIVIDPGHGGDDHGAEYNGIAEKHINLDIAEFLGFRLADHFEAIILTRAEDITVPLYDRAALANERDADLFLSIHCDAFTAPHATGMSVHIHPDCSNNTRRIAQSIHRSLTTCFSTHRDRGIRESNFFVLRKTNCPALLIECEFLSNPGMCEFLADRGNQATIAGAIATGVLTV